MGTAGGGGGNDELGSDGLGGDGLGVVFFHNPYTIFGDRYIVGGATLIMSTFSSPMKIAAIDGVYYNVAGTAIPVAPITSPVLVNPDIGTATATSINGMPLVRRQLD